MRFVFVDRILALDEGRRIEVIKNVTASEDVFHDHFPGWPIFPGALIIEVFEQAAQLLIGSAGRWERVGQLRRISRASFRQAVQPGDQLQARCERRPGAGDAWMVDAEARVGAHVVATATLELAVEDVGGDAGAQGQAIRFAELFRILDREPLALAGIAEWR